MKWQNHIHYQAREESSWGVPL